MSEPSFLVFLLLPRGFCFLFQSVAKMSLLCSTMNCTARFFACMSDISRSILWSRIMVGANTTAKFLGDIYPAV